MKSLSKLFPLSLISLGTKTGYHNRSTAPQAEAYIGSVIFLVDLSVGLDKHQ